MTEVVQKQHHYRLIISVIMFNTENIDIIFFIFIIKIIFTE